MATYSLDASIRREVLTVLLEKLDAWYVFPEMAVSIRDVLSGRLSDGDYDGLQGPEDFGRTLTEHIQEVASDKHLFVFVRHRSEVEGDAQAADQDPNHTEQARQRNFSFNKLERLGGNIGYLDLRGFEFPESAGETAIAAMRFVAHTNALIIDLRLNRGGDPSMVALLSSYLFDETPVHLNDLYWRKTDTTHQYWTFPYVPGVRYGAKAVYVLIGPSTFSAAEEFAYNLKTLRRATLVGQKTAGGANPGDIHQLCHGFEAFIPNGRAINPTTNTNWEGVGVTPDIEAPVEVALTTAHIAALEQWLACVEPSQPGLQAAIDEARQELMRLKQNV